MSRPSGGWRAHRWTRTTGRDQPSAVEACPACGDPPGLTRKSTSTPAELDVCRVCTAVLRVHPTWVEWIKDETTLTSKQARRVARQRELFPPTKQFPICPSCHMVGRVAIPVPDQPWAVDGREGFEDLPVGTGVCCKCGAVHLEVDGRRVPFVGPCNEATQEFLDTLLAKLRARGFPIRS